MNLVKATLLLTLIALFALPATAVTLNEIRVDQAGSDFDEFVELRGLPGESLNGVTLIVIGDGTGAGTIESVLDLSGYAIASDGYFLIVESTFTAACADAVDLVASLNMENGDDVTYLLVAGFTGANADDLDIDDDGTLDSTPWSSVLDSVGIDSPYEAGQLFYSDNIAGPDGTYAPGAVQVCDGTWFVTLFDLCAQDTPGFSNIDACSVATEGTSFDNLKAMYR